MSQEKLSPLFQLRNYILDFWRSDKRNFLEEVLTIVDASITDPQQRKGVKSLIQNVFYRENNHLEGNARIVLLEFVNKFCKDQKPETDTKEKAFKGNKTFAGYEDECPKIEYFN